MCACQVRGVPSGLQRAGTLFSYGYSVVCTGVPSMIESEVLKSPTIVVLFSTSPFSVLNV